ncbi:MAG TPA: Hsp20/alpha crystallin family protein, partial [Anaerolineales bacterium]|nr:Hsp20/alpha crystallin family protein [Anaerolineales bacterium]
KASLPGINPEDLNITYNNGVLTIQAESREDKEVKEDRYLVRERRFGSFSRSLSLPATINADAIEASYDAGILTLRLPKTEEVKPRRIQVRGGSGQRVIEGRTGNGVK